LKVFLIFEYLAKQTKVKLLLGPAVFKKLFDQTPEVAPQLERIRYRFVRGEAVGKILPPGTGKKDAKGASVNPSMCQHPEVQMKRRGNQAEKAWICLACLTRWQRLDISEINQTGEVPQNTDVLTFGKHMGSTYLEVYQNDQVYCRWIMATMDQQEGTEPIRKFASYINNKEMALTYEADPFVHVDNEDEDM